jgi:hypothetical protein
MQAEHRPVGLDQQLLAHPVDPGDLVADQRLAEPAGRPRPAHIGVGVVGVGHHPPKGVTLEGLTGPLGLRQLRHGQSIPSPRRFLISKTTGLQLREDDYAR